MKDVIGETEVLDREQLRNVSLEDPDLMRELLAALIEDTSRQIPTLGEAIRAHNAGETVRLAHYSKGACVNVGARSSAAILEEIERTAKAGDFDRCGASLESLAAEIVKLRDEALRI
jgi:HPt (histidine-containing phosphotransfer) domain-containing protein